MRWDNYLKDEMDDEMIKWSTISKIFIHPLSSNHQLKIDNILSSSTMSYIMSSNHQFQTFLAISGLAPCSIKIRDISGRS